MNCSARVWTCCAPRPRIPSAAAARLPRFSSTPQRFSIRSIRNSRATRISTHGARRYSPGGWRALAACTTYPAKCWPRRDRRATRVHLIFCCDGFALAFTDGRAAAAPVLQRAATGFGSSDVSVEEVLRWGWLATAAAVMVWDYETCLAVSTRGVELARAAGALARARRQPQRDGASCRTRGRVRQGGIAGR